MISDDILEDAELTEIWFWDGDLDHALGCIEGAESDWLVEKGVMRTENDDESGVCNLIEGDTVYRIRKARAFEQEDPREPLFAWWTIDPATGVETVRPF